VKSILIRTASVLSLIAWVVGFGLMLFSNNPIIRSTGAGLLLLGELLKWLGFNHDTFKSGGLPKELREINEKKSVNS
jgi:hypothetical protein